MNISMNDLVRQLPNLITILRGVAGAVGGWFLVASSRAEFEYEAARLGLMAASVFMIAAFTDWLDGTLARVLKTESALGALLDPIADKLLVGGYLIAYCVLSGFDLWLTLPVLIILGRDLVITGLRFARPRRGVLTVTWTAKAKTALQMGVVAAPFFMIALGWFPVSIWYHYWIGAVWFLALLTLWSAAPYWNASFGK